ncbi:MAG TPA: cupin domain-containing protein [Arenicellales bacterium]|nr:cupin domain-containing protein [Arenicellales bacterium]
MKPAVRHVSDRDEYWFVEGCFITELSNSDEDPAVSIARARVEPGVTTRWHRLTGISERYVIIEGTGRVELGGVDAQQVTAGDVVMIPPGTAQRITNTGDADLVFLAICSPRFVQQAYQNL